MKDMAIPNFKRKYASESVIKSEKHLDQLQGKGRFTTDLPPNAVLCCQNKIVADLLQNKFGSLVTQTAIVSGRCCVLKGLNLAVVYRTGIGAPAAAIAVEELATLGVKNLVLFGYAGGLQPDMQPGDTVVCQKALRDEGVSYHYLPESRYSYPSEPLTAAVLKNAMPARLGPCWTTDAPYRETEVELKAYRKQGLLAVDMEASAVFAVAKYRKVQAAAMFVISDILSEQGWKPMFHYKQLHEKFKASFSAALAALTGEK